MLGLAGQLRSGHPSSPGSHDPARTRVASGTSAASESATTRVWSVRSLRESQLSPHETGTAPGLPPAISVLSTPCGFWSKNTMIAGLCSDTMRFDDESKKTVRSRYYSLAERCLNLRSYCDCLNLRHYIAGNHGRESRASERSVLISNNLSSFD
jgi:hypothetical protein